VDGRLRQREAFALGKQFAQMRVVHPGVRRLGKAHDALPDSFTQAARRRASTIAMDEGLGPARTIGSAEPVDLADRPAQQLSGLGHEEIAPVEGVEDLQTLLGTWRQGNHASPSSAQRGEDIFADQLGGT
jgi:hypothetical protein